MKISVSKDKIVVVDYADTRFSKNFAKPLLPVHMGPRSNLSSQKKLVENLVTLSL